MLLFFILLLNINIKKYNIKNYNIKNFSNPFYQQLQHASLKLHGDEPRIL
jgi:hypothetical protein